MYSWNINAALSAENNTLVRPTSESVAKTSNITYDFDTDMAYIYHNEHDSSCEDIMVVLERENLIPNNKQKNNKKYP